MTLGFISKEIWRTNKPVPPAAKQAAPGTYAAFLTSGLYNPHLPETRW